MMITGWILSINSRGEYIELWIKKRDGEVVPAFYHYQPSFYVHPKEGIINTEQGEYILKKHKHITKVKKCKRYVYVTEHKKKEVIQVWVKSPLCFRKVVDDIKQTDYFDLYNIDIPITQKFLYEQDLFPISYCEFELDEENPSISYIAEETWPIIKRIILKESNEAIFYKLPPFRIIQLYLGTFGNEERSNLKKPLYRRPMYNEPLISCKIRLIEGYQDKKIENLIPPWQRENSINDFGDEEIILTVKEECEIETISKLSKLMKQLDPDIILTNHGDEYFFPYLLARASFCGCQRDLYLSRDQRPLKTNRFHISGDNKYFSYGVVRHRSPDQFYLRGRIHIDTRTYGSLHFKDGNIWGVVEVARISRVPIQRLVRITIGGALQSIQFYVAKEKGYLVPPEKKNSEDFQSTITLLNADRGGHIFEPKIGVFERVGEFDFTSMYPMIMVNYNISPDTINCDCCKHEENNHIPGLPFYTCKKRTGIIPQSLKLPLRKRIIYKKFSKKLPKKQAYIFDKMNQALKWILVVSFGYLGFRNARFGRVEGHQSVCAYSREIILQTRDMAHQKGFEVLHGIVDSMWLQHQDFHPAIIPDPNDENRPTIKGISHFTKSGLKSEILERELKKFREHSNKFAEEMKTKIKIPIGLDALYKFIVFLPSRQHPQIPVLNHYWGVTYEGKIKVRGIELRRRDAPKIVKRFQKEIIDILAESSGICEFMEKLSVAKRKYDEYQRLIDSGHLSAVDLVIKNIVSRKTNEYKVKSYQALASERLLAKGIDVEPGQKVEYIIKDASSKNPNNKIILRSEFEKYNRAFDKEKYKELLERSFQNIIPFDYSKITDDLDSWTPNISKNLNLDNDLDSLKPLKSGLDKYFI
ncbi:MAG: hypothetical protein GF364_08300 [Candidatus Lokiarchaeota archaeon]|nr:hypothetical protein [Candidatus Lokiarchaeota archaeon]